MLDSANRRARRAHVLLALACLMAATTETPGVQRPRAPQRNATMFRGGPERMGVGDPVSGHASAGVAWTFATEGPVRSSPTVSGGTLFVGSGDGHLYALDAATGAARWRFDAGSPIDSSPCVARGALYFTDRSGAVVALDRASGRLCWRVRTGDDLPLAWGREGWDVYTSSPAVVDDYVVVGSGDGYVYALDARTGTRRWRVRTGGRVRSSPAVSNGAVYVGSADGSLYGFELATGRQLWRFDADGRALSWRKFGYDRTTIQSSPAVDDGTVYVGSRDGRLYAVDARTGARRWQSEGTEAWVVTSPAVAGGLVFSGRSDDQYVSAVQTSTGGEVWRKETRGRVFSSPTVAGDTLFAGSAGRVLYALDAATGAERWQYRAGGAIYSSPATANGIVYFGCDDGRVYAIATSGKATARRAVFWDGTLLELASLPDHSAIRWYFEFWGYEVLDAGALAEFLRARIDDAAPSVVVFALDCVPSTVAAEPLASSLFRRYLGSGGKVVWLGLPPLLLKRDAATGAARFDWNEARGEDEGLDPDATARLLGVDYGDFVFDSHGVRLTPEGRRWGLSRWWVGYPGVDPSEVSSILAVDEAGKAAGWVKTYGGPPGTGFVQVWGGQAPIDSSRLDDVRRVAEYGLGRR